MSLRVVAARLGSALLTVSAATFLAFAVMTWLPGDPLAARSADGLGDARPLGRDARAALEADLHLDRPLVPRFAAWLGDAARGDLGRSILSGRPVTSEIRSRLGATLELNAVALALVAVFGLPLGWWAARRRGRADERAAALSLIALHALPAFWLALVLQSLFAVHWRVLPPFGRTPLGADGAGARLAHLALPALTLAAHALAYYARFARDTASEGLASIHALLARASGVPERRLFVQHAVRPSLVPLATLAGLSVPVFASGSVLIETVFAWPGLGRLLVRSIATRDLPVVVPLVAIAALLTVAGSVAADGLVRLADPRARRPESGGAA